VPDHHTVLSEILKHVPHARFKELIKSYNADGGSRRLDSKLVALLYGQLSGASGLRAIVEELESHAAALSELGCDPVKRSTLSDATGRPRCSATCWRRSWRKPSAAYAGTSRNPHT
jgi:hypothetical protein